MPLHLEIVTSERVAFSGEVDMVTVPGAGGVMGVLPHHAPVLSTLKPGELRVKIGDEVQEFAIGGGFVDIHDNRVIILADSAERADEIDIARAEAARARAEALLKNPPPNKEDLLKLEAALRRSTVRLNVAMRRRAHRSEARN
ncbi:MAG: F0F1 ATP synthase subunit epsilon [Chloroflexi bacterium]|jgi:F-type H+-transporting ATPase subunit epsilon|uniref:ATP synthase epsilon chain n=1 Tax=Candidatus Thermofonsia Clade 3 bacterium TaxID=2364212 RepID=A0A2M8QB32_9CHLR|nr:F0F1 ATP synthase subunit epsilon [Candidatus Roseilinea sp. NK_OTU-006]PJF46999.1 MAG: ATP synthase F1 subunit epsilon [Candidatus Thermofonsia Clade 3 bacterium]RMG63352.1 MAG: F0F1 ATP synthase subunit epsilon [Chloroflexota bacterium]